jgi:hypothetical protein
MDPLTLLLDVLIVLWLGAVLVGIVRAWSARPPRLGPLSAQAHDRFKMAWNHIVSEFVRAPGQATREAEALLYNVLAARGHPTTGDRLPPSMHEARRWIARERQDGTDALRQAMLNYRKAFDSVLGSRPAARRETPREREMA